MAYWHAQDQETLKQPRMFSYYWHNGSGAGGSSCWHVNTNLRILQERHILRYYWPRFRYFLCTASYAVHSMFLKRFLSCLTPCTRSGSCGSFGFLHSKQLSLHNSGCSERLWEDCRSACITGSAAWRKLQHWDLRVCERDCVSVRMANKSRCVVARLKVLIIEAESCSCGMEVTFASPLLLLQGFFLYFYRCKVSRIHIRHSPLANDPRRHSEVLIFRIWVGGNCYVLSIEVNELKVEDAIYELYRKSEL
jgi:hypothetical protein